MLKRHFGYIFNLILTIMKYIKLYESDNEYIADKDNFSNTTICYINSMDSLLCVKENIDGDVVVPDVPKDEPNDPIEPDVPTESESGETTPNYFIATYKVTHGYNNYGYTRSDLIIFNSEFSLSQITELYINDVKQNTIQYSYSKNGNDNSIYTIKCVMSDTFNNCSQMFNGCSNLLTLDLSSFNTSNVVNMDSMFSGCAKLTTLDLSSFNTSKVLDMNCMFCNCSNLTSLDVSNFNTSKVLDMDSMFSGCTKLTTLDLSSFNTSLLTSMDGMFSNCKSLTSLDLSNFKTSKVLRMDNMFSSCTALTLLNVSSFDTSNVTSMYGMFKGCTNLTILDLSNFNTSNVTEMSYMFSGNTNLMSLTFGQLSDLSKVTSKLDMFQKVTGRGILYYPLKYQESWETLLKKSSFPSTWQAIAVDYDNI